MKTTSVWLVRHGETEWSLSGQHSGRHDLPLTAHGEEEARRAKQVLGGTRFDLVLCSPLQRARRTCEIAGYADVAVIEPDAQEWDYGDVTGFTHEQMQERIPGWNVWDGPLTHGESIEDVAARARRVCERVRNVEGVVAIFAHGHFLRIFATQWLGLAPQNAKHLMLETSAVCVLGEDNGYPAILAWNRKVT